MTKTKTSTKLCRRLFSLALALLLLLILVPSPPAAAVDTSLKISSEAELQDFIKRCSMDSYSKNLSVTLTADIALRGSVSSVPIFYGSFDGGGHTISGIDIKTKGSQIGFFRSIESGASVYNLKLEGKVAPKGSATSVGILAGENRGSIASCFVSGSSAGENDVGGLVGKNCYGGMISGCSAEVSVSGKLRTGGIVGSNQGVIESCVSKGEVNTNAGEQVSVPNLSDLSDLGGLASNSLSDAVSDAVTGSDHSAEDREEAISADISDTGGIAGLNEGAIRGCTNRGSVGYQHVGYNTGGIAGTHNGIISSCENYGIILGRKDVGGIVGQFEPDMAVTFGASSGAALESQLSQLTGILRSLTDALTSGVGGSLKSADEINSAVGVIEDTLKGHSDAAGEEIEFTIDQLYGNLQIINTAADKINKHISDFNSVASTEMPVITSEFETISVALEQANVKSEVNSILTQLDVINAQIEIISNALAGLETLISGISDVMQDDTIIDKRSAVSDLVAAYYATVDSDAISTALTAISTSMDTINAKLKTINSKLSKSSAVIVQSMQMISSAASKLQSAFTTLTGGVSTQAAIINANIDKIEDLLYGYSGNAGERLEQTFDTVYIQLNLINTGLDDIITTADATNLEVYTLLNSALDQLDAIGRSVAALMDPPQYSTVDVSENIEQEEKPGQISSCRNNGTISADANVGGIAGIMALEMSSDPEEDFSMQDSLWVDTTALFRAIVMTCSNNAAVTAKNDCAGGAVGRCDLGAIYKTENLGATETTNGTSCGGIVGRSVGSVISCDALCDLSGNDYVGGIAGLGKNLSSCKAMVRIKSEGECLGAIAGDADGDIVANAFVEEDLQGIDGISYAGIAYPLPYADFISLEFINPIFSDLHADFLIDGKLIKRLPISYGGSIKSWDVPTLPKREDSFGVWEPFETENNLRSLTINAVYSPWITALSSSGELPMMLAEGEFSNKAVLEVEDTTPKLNIGGSKVLATYSYSLTDENGPDAEEYRLHLRCLDSGDISVSLKTDEGSVKLPTRRDGSYLIFSAPATGELVVEKSLTKKIIIVTFIVLAVLILLGFFIYLQKHFPKDGEKKGKKPKPDANEKKRVHTMAVKKAPKSQKSDKKPRKKKKSEPCYDPKPTKTRGKKEKFVSKSVTPGDDFSPFPTPQKAPLSAEQSSPAAEKVGSRLDIVIGEDGVDRKI